MFHWFLYWVRVYIVQNSSGSNLGFGGLINTLTLFKKTNIVISLRGCINKEYLKLHQFQNHAKPKITQFF